MPLDEFQDFFQRLKQGDSEAWKELVGSYDGPIRMKVRAFIRDRGLQNEVDSQDVWQSTIRTFLRRDMSGCTFETIQDFRKWLLTVALNRIRDRARRHRPGPLVETDIEAQGPSPSEQVATRDCLEEIQQRLSEETRQLFSWKELEGLSWMEIVQRLGRNPQTIHALQTRYRRELLCVLEQLGLLDE